MVKNIFLFIILILAINSVMAIDYIKSVEKIPFDRGYEIILGYDVNKEDINGIFINDDTNKIDNLVIKKYYPMPDGTTKIETNYIANADRIIFYYADTFADWNLAAMDSICDYSDLQTINAPDCVNERGNPISMENVRLYKDSKVLHVDLKNTGNKEIDIAPYNFYFNWGSFITGTIGDLDEGEKIILKPNEIYHYTIRYPDGYSKCGENLFIGLIKFKGDGAVAIHNRDLECLNHQPNCGDFVCSKYEELLNCDIDCKNPINLKINDGNLNGISFDYSYTGDSCIYEILNPNGELFTLKDSLKNYKNKNFIDTNIRYQNQNSEKITSMFTTLISGEYNFNLICYDKGVEISKQNSEIFICTGCEIEGECIRRDSVFKKYYCDNNAKSNKCEGCFIEKNCVQKNTLNDNLYCNSEGNIEELGLFNKIIMNIKLFFI